MNTNSWNDTSSPQSNPTPSAFPAWDKAPQDAVLAEWERRKKALTEAKDGEMEFRKYVVSRAFPQKSEGVNNIELNNGYKLKATIKYLYNLDKDNSKIEAMLDKLCKVDNNGSFLADRLINWHPTLSLTEYRELEPKYKQIVDTVVTIMDAAPSLEIVVPKIKK